MYLIDGRLYKNKKTGNLYFIIDFAYDAESEVPKERQRPFVIYKRIENSHPEIWVRSHKNFKEKFEAVMYDGEHTTIDNMHIDYL
jgi:hypothetical protein